MSRYEIRFDGQLDRGWSDWFDGFTVTNARDGTTSLTGPVADQAALHGLLRRVGDLGLTLISLNLLTPASATEPPPNPRRAPVDKESRA